MEGLDPEGRSEVGLEKERAYDIIGDANETLRFAVLGRCGGQEKR